MNNVSLDQNDYKWYKNFGFWKAIDKNSNYLYITKRCGGVKPDYWGGLSEDGIEFKIKWV
tara:strand:+ start:275 stop:454 length:180 start_codon:yes stop_codon:yes gene_type:complete